MRTKCSTVAPQIVRAVVAHTPETLLARAALVLGGEEANRLYALPMVELHREFGKAHQAFRDKEAAAVRDVITARTAFLPR